MRSLLVLLLLVPTAISAQGGPTSNESSAKQSQAAGRNWREYQARLQAIGGPGEAALRRERARRKERFCTTRADMANHEAELKCRVAENQITEANYVAFSSMISKMLRLNAHAYPEIPDSQPLPFEAAERSWRDARAAICAARVNPGHTPEPPNASKEDMELGCVMFLTQEHMEELSELYFLVLEGVH